MAASSNGLLFRRVSSAKCLTFAGLMVLALSAIYIGTLRRWREALADFAAVTSQGETALALAERLICDSREGDATLLTGRPDRVERRAAISLTAFHWILLGAVIVTASTFLGSQFTYLWTNGLLGHYWSGYEWIAAFCLDFVAYAGFLIALLVIAEHVGFTSNNWSNVRLLSIPALFLIMGAALGYIFTQATPLMISSSFMPSGYHHVLKHYPGPLLLSTTLSQLGVNAWRVILALLGVAAARAFGYRFAAWLPGMLWAGLSLVEQKMFPSLLLGGVTVVSVGLFAVLVAAIGSRGVAMRDLPRWLPIIGLSSLYWIGLGEVNHIAAVSLNAAVQAEYREDWTRAVDLHRRVVRHAPGLVKTKIVFGTSSFSA